MSESNGNTQFELRRASVQGTKHIQNGWNNQDASLAESFRIDAWGKEYNIGLVSDGCTGLPAFSRTAVGSNLLVCYAYSRIQELICAGIDLKDIPIPLFHAVTEFIRDLSQKIMPQTVNWGYLNGLPKTHADRLRWSATKRFRVDYLSATLLGFITDGETIVIFSAGDGVIIVNDDVAVIDQDDRPEYPASSINAPGKGFEVQVYNVEDVQRLAIVTDGPEKLLRKPEFVERCFSHKSGNPMGLQFVFNIARRKNPELMTDDCTAVTLVRS